MLLLLESWRVLALRHLIVALARVLVDHQTDSVVTWLQVLLWLLPMWPSWLWLPSVLVLIKASDVIVGGVIRELALLVITLVIGRRVLLMQRRARRVCLSARRRCHRLLQSVRILVRLCRVINSRLLIVPVCLARPSLAFLGRIAVGSWLVLHIGRACWVRLGPLVAGKVAVVTILLLVPGEGI